MSQSHWIGVDLGGTKILAGLFDENLNLLARSKQPTGSESGPQGVFMRLAQAMDAVVREAHVSRESIAGIGLAVPGQIDHAKQRVRFAPNLVWKDLDPREFMPKEWACPLVLENDVRMGTYGEFARGHARGSQNIFGIFVGTGVGGGLILNGELYNGFNGHAGEIGHIVVDWRRGHTLESIAGRKFQMKRAKDLLDDAPKRIRKEWKGIDLAKVKSSQLAEFYQKSDAIAVRVIDDAARAVGTTVASVVNLLSPEVVIVGGGVAGALGESFLERIWDIAQRFFLPGAAEGIKFLPAALGDDAAIVGVAAYAQVKLNQKLELNLTEPLSA